MFKKVLFPTDGSELSLIAAEAVIDLVKEVKGELVALSVFSEVIYPAMMEVQALDLESVREQARGIFAGYAADVAKMAADKGVPCTVRVEENLQPHRAIIDVARELHCDLIAMASHGRKGISAFLLGSETQKVLAHSAIPVLVYR